jgi:hypothetical protein
MKILEYISTHRDSRTNLTDPFVCADGTHFSVQASSSHYCSPRKTIDPSLYRSVEVLASTELTELSEFFSARYEGDYLYGFCPVDLVDSAIASHGGINEH